MDCSPPGFSFRWILQARVLEWVVNPFPRGSSRTLVSCNAGRLVGCANFKGILPWFTNLCCPCPGPQREWREVRTHIKVFITIYSLDCMCELGTLKKVEACYMLSHFGHVQLFVTSWTVCSPPGSFIRGILQARILGWISMPTTRGSSQLRDRTPVSCSLCIAGRFFTTEPPEAPKKVEGWGERSYCCIVL